MKLDRFEHCTVMVAIHSHAFTATLPLPALLECLRSRGDILNEWKVVSNWVLSSTGRMCTNTLGTGLAARPRVRVDGPAAARARGSLSSVHDVGSLRLRVLGASTGAAAEAFSAAEVLEPVTLISMKVEVGMLAAGTLMAFSAAGALVVVSAVGGALGTLTELAVTSVGSKCIRAMNGPCTAVDLPVALLTSACAESERN